jgi:type IV pilus assembly protein PilV
MAHKRSSRRGSTVIEVLMAITVLAIGASGVVALQKVTTSANRNSRSIAVANEVSRTWIERLRMDAMLWNHPSATNSVDDLVTDTQWLKKLEAAGGSNPTAWFRPTNANNSSCGIHDVFGRDQGCDGTGPYCVNVRLAWLRADRRMIRAEVRVYWVGRNEGDNAIDAADLPCGDADDPPDVDALAADGVFRVVHAVTAVTKNEAP